MYVHVFAFICNFYKRFDLCLENCSFTSFITYKKTSRLAVALLSYSVRNFSCII